MEKKTTNSEIIAIDNTLKLLRRGKWEMEGEEVLAFYRLFEFWVKKLNELKQPPVVISQIEEPIKSSSEPSTSKKSNKGKKDGNKQ